MNRIQVKGFGDCHRAPAGRSARFSLCAAALAVLAGAADAKPELGLSYYAPDRGTRYAWNEVAAGIEMFLDRDYRAAGLGCLYIYTTGDEPVSAVDLTWNGTPFEELRGRHELVWWRMLPDTIEPGGWAEVLVRPRYPLAAPATVEVSLSDGSTVEAILSPEANPLRITTAGFNEAMDEVFLVVEAVDGGKHEVRRCLIDGKPARGQTRILDPEFSSGLCPISLRLREPLEYGSYHVYTVEAGEGVAAACCLRTYDGWVPLGTYGYNRFDDFARNSCNGHNNFSRYGRGDLDAMSELGMRSCMIAGDDAPDPAIVGHPALLGYCPMDEPDCHDYNHDEIADHGLRVGAEAMHVEECLRRYRTADPRTLTYLTLDLTYKPANFYIYGPMADMCNPDCYPLMIDADPRMVREVVETARHGAGPRPVTFTYQSGYIEPGEEETPTRKARAPFADEMRTMMYYAIGAGARGLWNYIHCTEGESHGTQEYPELWYAIGQTYRELGRVAPLLGRAHPTELARCEQPSVWLRTLICGEDAMLIVCVNDQYESRADAFVAEPRADITLALPELPWISPKAAWQVTESGFAPLRLSDDGRIVLPKLASVALMLVSADAELAGELEAGFVERETQRARGLLRLEQARQRDDARFADLRRTLESRWAAFLVAGEGIGAYGARPAGFWNPRGTEYNAFEFGVNEKIEGPTMGAKWPISAVAAGDPLVAYALTTSWGEPAEWTLLDAAGRPLGITAQAQMPGTPLTVLEFEPPAGGEYSLQFTQSGEGPRGGQASQVIYVVPRDVAPLLASAL